jgi:hypothetical protein
LIFKTEQEKLMLKLETVLKLMNYCPVFQIHNVLLYSHS